MKISFGICLGLLVLGAKAQGQPESVKSVEVNVVDRYKANIKSATKLGDQPSFTDTSTSKLPVKYSIKPQMLQFQYRPQPIQPVRVSGVRLGKLPNNFVRLGAGNYGSALAEVILSNSRSQRFNWDVGLRHFSSQKGVKNSYYDKSPYMENNLNLGGRWIFKNYRLKANAGVDWNSNSYYGLPDTINDVLFAVPKDLQKNAYQRYYGGLMFDRIFKRSTSIFQNAGINYHYFTNNWETTESLIGLKTTWQLPQKVEDHLLGADLNVDIQKTNMGVSMQDWSQLNVQFFPQAVGKLARVNYTLGLNFNFFNTSKTVGGQESSNFATYFFPHIIIETELVRDLLFVFGGWTGDVQMNGMYELTKQNPFLLPEVNNLAPTAMHKIYAGVEGAVAKDISYKIEGGINYVRSMPLFFRSGNVPTFAFDGQNLAAFNVAYARGNYINLRGELGYVKNNTEISAYGEYFDYSLYINKTGDLNNPFHLPTLKIGAEVTQVIKEKITAQAGLAFIGGRKALQQDGLIYKADMNNIVDIKLGVGYKVNNNLSANLDIANMLSQNYDLWLGNPVQRFRVMFSLMYNF